jgi:hypothetical protein
MNREINSPYYMEDWFLLALSFFEHFKEVRDTLRQGKFLKILRIEMENYPIIMTMGS